MHEIIVENVGSVYYGEDESAAQQKYDSYAGRYKPWGLYYYADVTWIEDNDIRQEYNDPERKEEDHDA
jgi:hypothetical protein